MIEGSKDPEINRIRFRSSNKMFQNSSCVFVEYIDCIQIPWFTFLTFLKEETKFDELFNMDEIRYLSPRALLGWYFNRKEKNPLMELLKDDKHISREEMDSMLASIVNTEEIFFNVNIDTNIHPIIGNLIANEITKKIIVYYPEENEYVKKDVHDKFGDYAEVVFGDIRQVLQKVPKDTTYFFSDVMHLLVMEELKKLDFSAIMIPNNYRYNFVDDDKKEYLVNMKYLSEKYVFKWGVYSVA